METIGLRELNQNPSKAVARVRAGVSILVTDRGQPVLRMIPEVAGGSLLQRMVMAGEVQPPSESAMPDVLDDLAELPGDLGDLLIAERDRERLR
jgi:prevent-host-death family protein